MAKLFNILFYSQLILHSVIYVFILFFYLIPPMPFFSSEKNRIQIRKAIKLYGKWVLKFAIFPYVKIIYRDLSTKKPLPGIFICNHRSASDAYLLALLDAELVQIAKQWPFRLPLYGFFAKKGEYISIFDLTFEELQKRCSELFAKDVSIAVFPEGTRSGNKKVGNFNSSMFRVAIKNRCPIYPVCITGNEKIPDRNFNVSPGTIRVNKLEPLLWEDYKNMTPFQLKNYVRSIIIEETGRMDK